LPRKGQLAILTLARLSEPFAQTSLTAYLFYQLKSFDTTLADSTIAAQGGMIQAAYPAAQLVTAALWGRAADTDWIGRKRVVLIGLFSTCLAYVGYGFSKSFAQAMAYRVLGGALNGSVGVIRTVVSETVKGTLSLFQDCDEVLLTTS
jgi:MFS family permease